MARQRRRTHWLSYIVLAIALIVLAAILLVRHLLDPQRFAALIAGSAAAAGLELELDGPARPALLPRPAVELDGLRLALPQHRGTVVAVDRMRLVVPWRALWAGETVIERLELHAPTIDLASLRTWLDGRADGAPSTPAMPAINVGVSIQHGTLVSGDKLLLEAISLSTGALIAGQAFELVLDARDRVGQPVELDIRFVPGAVPGIVLDPVRVHARIGSDEELEFKGSLAWQGGQKLDAELNGSVRHRSATYSATMRATTANAIDIAFDGEGNKIAFALDPAAAAAWLGSIADANATGIALPPVRGAARIERVELGGWSIDGLDIQRGRTQPAAAASVAPQP